MFRLNFEAHSKQHGLTTLQCYIKTERGIAELEQRQLALNPKQRRVLLLIDSPAFLQLNPTQQQRWVCEQIITELTALNLITVKTAQNIKAKAETRQYIRQTATSTKSDESEITASARLRPSVEKTVTESLKKINAPVHELKEKTVQRSLAQAVEFKVLSFAQIQTFMIESLQQFCGLMAKPLIEQIAQARSITQLKHCQIQWLTHLQESRMSPVQLSFSCQQLNFAMNAL